MKDLPQFVRKVYGGDPADTPGEVCKVVGLADFPTYVLETPTGGQFNWAVQLCKPADNADAAVYWGARCRHLEAKAAASEQKSVSTTSRPCRYCGYGHAAPDEGCPRVRSIRYWPDGTVRAVSLMTMEEMLRSLPAAEDMEWRFRSLGAEA